MLNRILGIAVVMVIGARARLGVGSGHHESTEFADDRRFDTGGGEPVLALDPCQGEGGRDRARQSATTRVLAVPAWPGRVRAPTTLSSRSRSPAAEIGLFVPLELCGRAGFRRRAWRLTSLDGGSLLRLRWPTAAVLRPASRAARVIRMRRDSPARSLSPAPARTLRSSTRTA